MNTASSVASTPLNMRQMPSSGHMQHSLLASQSMNVATKGKGILSNVTGYGKGRIRPLTNLDPGNVFPSIHNKPRPIKHYRNGRLILPLYDETIPPEIFRNIYRFVKSDQGSAISNSSNILSDFETPGGICVPQSINNTNNKIIYQNGSVPIITSFSPNPSYQSENPNMLTINKINCCNAEKHAKRRVIYASTNINKKYYVNNKQYLQSRCQLYEQKAFPQQSLHDGGLNEYVANCQNTCCSYIKSTLHDFFNYVLDIFENKGYLSSLDRPINNFNSLKEFEKWLTSYIFLNIENQNEIENLYNEILLDPLWDIPSLLADQRNICRRTVYKPSNRQFAVEGAVSSSLRTFKLNQTTIECNAFKDIPPKFNNNIIYPCRENCISYPYVRVF